MASLMFREEQVLLAIPVHDEDTLAGTKCRFDGVREPRSILRQELRLHDEAIDDDLDIVLLLLVEDDVVLEGENFAVDSNSREPASTRLLQERFVLSLAFADERCEQLKPGSRPETADLFDDLLRRLLRHRTPAAMAVRSTDPREKDPEVVVDLGDGSHRRARVVRRGLLIDGNRRRETADGVVEGLFHLAEKLARVARKRLDVAPLTLGVEGIEGQRRLARTGDPAENDELFLGDLDGDVFQVVLTSAADDDAIRFHDGWRLARTGNCVKAISPIPV